jgi:hypothetical protein
VLFRSVDAAFKNYSGSTFLGTEVGPNTNPSSAGTTGEITGVQGIVNRCEQSGYGFTLWCYADWADNYHTWGLQITHTRTYPLITAAATEISRRLDPQKTLPDLRISYSQNGAVTLAVTSMSDYKLRIIRADGKIVKTLTGGNTAVFNFPKTEFARGVYMLVFFDRTRTISKMMPVY